MLLKEVGSEEFKVIQLNLVLFRVSCLRFCQGFRVEDNVLTENNVLGCAAEKSDVERGIYGTGAHSDYGLLTLLATDDVPGLQVQTTFSIPVY